VKGLSREKGAGWMLLLAPFIWTLMLLGGEEQEEAVPPSSTYTLY
jgi:hypothetical protein